VLLLGGLWGALAWGESVLLPDLVVTAASQPAARTGDVWLAETTGSYDRVPRARFAGRMTDLGRVLERQAGVQVRRTGGLGSFSTATLRGASAQQVQVLLDGLPLNGAYGGLVNLGEIALGQVRDVSIYRGIVPIQFARGGLGGAVDIRTRRATKAPLTELGGGGGSFGTGRGHLFHAGGRSGTDWLLGGEYFHTDGDFPFVNDRGTAFNPADDFPDRRHNAWIDQGSGLFKLGRDLGAGRRLDALVQGFVRAEGLPTRDNHPAARATLRTSDFGGQLRYTAEGLGDGAWSVTGRGFVVRRDEQYDDRLSQIGLAAQDIDAVTWRYGAQAYAERLGETATWSFNVQVTRETYDAHDRLRDRRGTRARRFATDAGGQVAWYGMDERLLVVPALRVLWQRDEATATPARSHAWLTPQLGLRWAWNERTLLRTNAAYYARPPAFFELYGDRGFIIGNPDLRAETGIHLDLGVAAEGEARGRWPAWRLGLTGFFSRIDDAIAFIYDAQGVGRAVNIGRAEVAGLEAQAHLAWETGTTLDLNLTWQDPRNRSRVAAFDGKRLPGRYRGVVDLELSQSAGRLRFYYRLHYAEGLFYDRPNLLSATPVLRHDAGLRMDLGPLRLALQVDNLTDEHFEQFNGFPTPGRAWYATLTYRFPSTED